MEVSTTTPPSPDLIFYYTMTLILGIALVGMITWSVNRYISATKLMIDEIRTNMSELKDSHIAMSRVVTGHEEKHKSAEVAQQRIERHSETIMKEFNATLQKIDTTFRMLMAERTERDIKRSKG